MDTPNYNIYLYLRKNRPNKEGRYPIYIRIRVNNHKTEFPSGQYIEAINWNDKLQKVSKSKEAKNINSMLDAIQSNINQSVSQLYISQTPITIDNIRKLIKGETVKEDYTLIRVAEEHNKHFESMIDTKYSKGSYKNYKTTLKYLIEFVPVYSKKRDIPLDEVNYKFCESYFSFLTSKKLPYKWCK